MQQVFISYSSKDEHQANEIVAILEQQGISCWIAPRNIRVGSNYTKDIPSAIRKCPCFLLVLSPRAQDSVWVNMELSRAIKHHKRIFPLMIEAFDIEESFDFLLEIAQIRPFYQAKQQILEEVIEEVHSLTSHQPQHEIPSQQYVDSGKRQSYTSALPDRINCVPDIVYENHPELDTPFFQMDGTHSIRIPFAVNDQNIVQYFEIGGNTSNHALLVGASGTGKSIALHTLILQTIKNYHPDDVEVWAIDYKGIEFNTYSEQQPPHFRAILNNGHSRPSLKHLIDYLMAKFELRLETFKKCGVANIVQYRQMRSTHCMPRVLVFLDDCDLLFWDLQSQQDHEYLNKLSILLRIARAVGFSFVFSSQYPVVLELNQTISNHIATHLYFNGSDYTMRSILSYSADPDILLDDISSLRRGQCIYKKSFWDIHDYDGNSTSQASLVNILYINHAASNEIISNAKKLIGTNYAPKSNITLST